MVNLSTLSPTARARYDGLDKAEPNLGVFYRLFRGGALTQAEYTAIGEHCIAIEEVLEAARVRTVVESI